MKTTIKIEPERVNPNKIRPGEAFKQDIDGPVWMVGKTSHKNMATRLTDGSIIELTEFNNVIPLEQIKDAEFTLKL